MIYPAPRLKDGRLPQITSGWEWRGSVFHYGVDIFYKRKNETDDVQENWIVPLGTSALSPWDGVVEYARQETRGLAIKIQHNNGLSSAHRHLYQMYVVPGQHVKAGQAIGKIGDDPTNSGDGRHLHFELWKDGAAINPEPYLQDATYVPDPHNGAWLTTLLLVGIGAGLVYYLIK